RLRLGEKSGRLARELVSPAQCSVFALKVVDALPVVSREPGPATAVALGQPDPISQRLGRAADLACEGLDGCHCEAYSASCSNTSRTARSRTSEEYFSALIMTPTSQELEPPANLGRFSGRRDSGGHTLA